LLRRYSEILDYHNVENGGGGTDDGGNHAMDEFTNGN